MPKQFSEVLVVVQVTHPVDDKCFHEVGQHKIVQVRRPFEDRSDLNAAYSVAVNEGLVPACPVCARLLVRG